MYARTYASIILAAMTCPLAAETVVLQQGAEGYAGCVAATLRAEEKGRAEPAEASVLALRGSKNRALLKFTLPEALRAKRLAA